MSWNINKNRETAQDLKNSVKTGSLHSDRGVTERKMAENSIRETEERYRLIMEGVNVIGWEYDPSKDCFTFVSGKAQEITGYTPKQWREKGFWASHIHPEDRDFTIKYCENATKRGEDHEFEYRMITADGNFVWFRDIVQVVFNNDKVAGLRGIFIDVTKQKLMGEELLQGKKFLEGILDGIQDGISVLDKDLKVLHVNHTMNRWYSDSLPLTGKQCFQAYHGKSEPCEACPALRAIEKGTLQMNVMPFTGLHGKTGWQEKFAFPLKDEKNNVTGVIEYVRDVTEKKKVEELLKSSFDYLQKLNDSLGDVILTVKVPERIIEYVNCTVESVFGYKPDECIGKKTKMFYSGVEEYHDFGRLLKNAIKEGKKELRVEKLFKRKNGEIFTCEITTTFLKENEKITRCISILHDISERKEAEELLQKQKKDLEFKNIALREVLGQIELEKKLVKDNVIANAEKLLLPIIEKIRLKGESRKYIKLLRKGLKELTSSFGAKLTEKEAKLTSREIEICNMIKNGLVSVEIADLLNLSLRTIEKHRAHIRKKLGIAKKGANLVSFLKTL